MDFRPPLFVLEFWQRFIGQQLDQFAVGNFAAEHAAGFVVAELQPAERLEHFGKLAVTVGAGVEVG